MPAQSDAQRRIAELTTLNALSQTLNRAVDLREALDAALVHIVELLGLHTGWIFLTDDAGKFRLAARHSLPPAIAYPGPAWQDGCTCQDLCAEGRLTQAVNVVRCSRLRSAVGDKRGLARHASVPIRNGDEILGILNVATTEFGNFTPAQLQLLSAIGNLLGTAIARARLYEQVKVRRVQEQAALLQLSQDLLGATGLDSALQRLVRVGARLLEVEACAFVEADEAQGVARLVVAHGWQFLNNTSLPAVLDPQQPHLWYLPERSADLATDAMSPLPPLLKAQRFRGHMAAAVTINGVPAGMLLVNSRAPRRFLDDEAQLLDLLASQLAQTLERERLHQEVLARQRLEQQLALARDIQASFLPDACPRFPGYAIAAFYRAAEQVGGDFYDFIGLPESGAALPAGGAPVAAARPALTRRDLELEFWRTGRGAPRAARPEPPVIAGRLGIVIADVTDKGVPAALFMALSRTIIRATASDGRAPREVLEQSNRLLLADARAGLFVTTFYGILDGATGCVEYADAGHNYPLLCRAATGQIEQLQASGMVLGVVPEPRFEQRRVVLAPGDVLCLYTDGVTEAMDARRQLFGEERLHAVLRANARGTPDDVLNAILNAVHDFSAVGPQADDITLVVIKRDGGVP